MRVVEKALDGLNANSSLRENQLQKDTQVENSRNSINSKNFASKL